MEGGDKNECCQILVPGHQDTDVKSLETGEENLILS